MASFSKYEGMIEGYEVNTFCGQVVIPKTQVTIVVSRTLKNCLGHSDMGTDSLLEYSDFENIINLAKNDRELLTELNMVIKRNDNSFETNM